ncbi:MAG: hypothetical protein HGB18_01380 [Candidatus Moranbacteria bacterium]|nr:hypothetical protein [Candidatus Moranbacteria bacterium]
MFCTDISQPFLFLFSDSVPSTLLYYSHIPTALFALIFGWSIFMRRRELLAAKLLLALVSVFALWSFTDLIVWVNVDSRIVSFFWSFFGIIYALLFLSVLYFFLVFVNDGRDVPFRTKLVMAGLFLPVAVLSATSYHVESFNLVSCEATSGALYERYYYLVGAVAFIWVLVTMLRCYQRTESRSDRSMKLLLAIGIEMFLALFFVTSYVSSVTDSFYLEQYGMFGMTIFLVFLGVLISKYRMFNIRVIGAQLLVAGIFGLMTARFFYPQTKEGMVISIANLILTSVAGYFLVRSVRREVERKEELQRISDSLAQANQRLKSLDNAKSEFISIASHQLRTPLTAIKGYLSLILEGSYGEVSREIEDVLEKVNLVNRHLIQLVEDLLNVSRIDTGRIRYSFEPAHSELIVADLADMFQPIARERGLELRLRLPKKSLRRVPLDAPKIREALSNLIDNAIKYTEQGSVTVSVEDIGHTRVRMSVTDTGMGFEPGMAEEIFGKFVRTAETTKKCVSGTGLGLYVGRKFVEAHGGRMWAESDGPGTGSRFIIEIPYANPGAEGGSGEA